jgi:hypothetical protein
MTPPNLRLWPLAHLLLMSWGQENSQEGEEQYLRHSAGRSCHAKGVREHLQGEARVPARALAGVAGLLIQRCRW